MYSSEQKELTLMTKKRRNTICASQGEKGESKTDRETRKSDREKKDGERERQRQREREREGGEGFK